MSRCMRGEYRLYRGHWGPVGAARWEACGEIIVSEEGEAVVLRWDGRGDRPLWDESRTEVEYIEVLGGEGGHWEEVEGDAG